MKLREEIEDWYDEYEVHDLLHNSLLKDVLALIENLRTVQAAVDATR